MALALKFGARDVRILADEPVYQGHFQVRKLTVSHRRFAGDWSPPVQREVFHRGDAVGVLPWDPVSDTLVLVEQFRPGALRSAGSPWMLELIAGVVEEGEADEQVIAREAIEEADCEMDLLAPIATYYPSAGACSEQVRLFCGRLVRAGFGQVHGADAEDEDILVHAVPRREALELLALDRVPNGHTLVALQWLQLHGDALLEAWR
jgi:ADP-ribose pyrophosphatase